MNYTIERHDQDDGTIDYECWSLNPYYRVFCISDFESDHAKRDSEYLCKLLNNNYKQP